MKEFITAHVEKIKPLDKQANLAWWDAAVTGDPKAYDRSSEMQLQIRRVYSDPKDFAFLKEVKAVRAGQGPAPGPATDGALQRLSGQPDRAGAAQADRRAGHADREELQHLPRHASTARRSRTTRSRTSSRTRPIPPSGRRPGWRASRSVRRSRRTWSGWSSCATRPPASSASTTTTRWPWPPASRTSRNWTRSSPICTSGRTSPSRR